MSEWRGFGMEWISLRRVMPKGLKKPPRSYLPVVAVHSPVKESSFVFRSRVLASLVLYIDSHHFRSALHSWTFLVPVLLHLNS